MMLASIRESPPHLVLYHPTNPFLCHILFISISSTPSSTHVFYTLYNWSFA